MLLQAGETASTFKFSGMKHESAGAAPRSDVCYYLIETPRGVFETGTLSLTFKQILNMDVHLYKSKRETTEITTSSATSVSDGTGVVAENQPFELDQLEMFILIALPKIGGAETNIEFEYRTAGTLNPWYYRWYLQYFTGSQSKILFVVLAVMCGIYLCLCGCLCVYGIKRCRRDPEEEERIKQSKAIVPMPPIADPWSS